MENLQNNKYTYRNWCYWSLLPHFIQLSMAGKCKIIWLLQCLTNKSNECISLFLVQCSIQRKLCKLKVEAWMEWFPWLMFQREILAGWCHSLAILSKMVDLCGAVTIRMIFDLDIVGLRNRLIGWQGYQIGHWICICICQWFGSHKPQLCLSSGWNICTFIIVWLRTRWSIPHIFHNHWWSFQIAW